MNKEEILKGIMPRLAKKYGWHNQNGEWWCGSKDRIDMRHLIYLGDLFDEVKLALDTSSTLSAPSETKSEPK